MQPGWNLAGASFEIIVVGTTGQAFEKNNFLDCRPLFQPGPDLVVGTVLSIFMVIRPAIFTDIQPPWERGELTIIRL